MRASELPITDEKKNEFQGLRWCAKGHTASYKCVCVCVCDNNRTV